MIRRTGFTSKYLCFLQTPARLNSGHVDEMILQSVDAGQMKTALRVFSQCLTTHDIKLVLFV